MPKLKVTLDGETKEVDFADVTLPDGAALMTREQYTSFKDSADQKIKRKERELKKKLLTDDEFFTQMAERRGEEVKDTARELAQTKALLEQATEDLSTYKEENQQLTRSDIRNHLVKGALKAGLKKALIDSPFLDMYVDKFGKTEKGSVALREGDDFSFSKTPKEGRPFVEPEEFFSTLRADPELKDFFADNRPSSSGIGPSDGASGTGRTWRSSEVTKLSTEQYAKHREDINKARQDGRYIVDV